MAKIILLLLVAGCHVIYAQDRPLPSTLPVPTVAPQRCPMTTIQLLRLGCDRGCIGTVTGTVTTRRIVCPVCRDNCEDAPDECRPRQQSSCRANETCLAVGAGGRYTCIGHLTEGENCTAAMDGVDEVIRRTNILSSVNARDRVHRISVAAVPCLAGLVCRRESLNVGVCMAESGPCPRARETNSQLWCDEDGSYQPLQCTKMAASRTYQCRCVVPSTGVEVPNTQVELRNLADRPDCEDMVRARCQYRSSLGALFEVRSGEKFINPRNCTRCLCRDGEATLCQPLGERACARLNPTPERDMNCTVRGRILTNGQSIAVDCNRCACKNGRLSCTRRECEPDEQVNEDEDDPMEERNCRSCGTMRRQPVCGRDGRTYASMCYAVNCRGLSADQLTEGSCMRRDVCGENPCEDGQVCLKSGGVTCLSREGCRPERLRRCVDLETLRCSAREGDDDDDDDDAGEGADLEDEVSDDETVCGRDGRSYSSVCNLIQNSTQTEVAYAGRCNNTNCAGGQVCGTDGETHDNICELRSNSANARLDYRGECMSAGSDDPVNERCTRLRSSGRCSRLTGCRNRIRPGDGCCPVCGAAVIIGLDREALDEYVSLNPSVDTVDELLKILVASRFIPEDIVRRCRVAANLLRTGDLHVVLESVNGSESSCATAAENMAERINNPPNSTSTLSNSANPQVLQFVTVAETAPLVKETEALAITENGAENGATSVAAFTIAVMLLTVVTLLI